MDTNQNTANNYQINTFVKGMNSDTSYDMIGADQYLFGQNIRITNNTLLFGDQHQNFTEGVVTPVYVGQELDLGYPSSGQIRILAADSIDNYGIIITGYGNHWDVLKVKKNDDGILEHEEDFILYSWDNEKPLPNTFSIVLHKETDNVINLYISDGEHPVIQMNILEDPNVLFETDIDCLISGRLLPTDRLILEKTSGRLKTQQVQYTYRFYRKYGATTKLAPLTNKFNVIDSNRNKEQGNAEDTRTSIGFKLILVPSSDWTNNYNRLQIYRISYIKPGEAPHVYLIHDDEFSGNVEIVDKGDEELQELSLDEFSALDSQIIIPQSLEANQGYLFAGNIKDDTKFYIDPIKLIGNTIELVETRVPIDYENIPKINLNDLVVENSTETYKQYLQDCCVYINDETQQYDNINYNDIVGSSLFRSLRRDETYRYGVVYYDKYGATSNVIHIGDLETNTSHDITSIGTDAETQQKILWAKVLGAKCTVKTNNIDGHDIVGYQIVRCEKVDSYTKNLLQVALSRPSRQSRYEIKNGEQTQDPEYRTPYYPNVYLSTQFLYITYLTQEDIKAGRNIPYKGDIWTSYFDYAGTNVENMTLYQAFAPEINVLRKDIASKLTLDTVTLNPIRFAYIDENIEKISAMFESLASRLDTTNTAKVHFVKDGIDSKEEIVYANIKNATNVNITQQRTISISHPQVSYVTEHIQLFVPNGYKITSAKYVPVSGDVTNATYYEQGSFIYDFDNGDGIWYTQYVIDGNISEQETLEITLEERSSEIGIHLSDIWYEAGVLFSSLDQKAQDMHRLTDEKTFISVRSKLQSKREDKSGHNVVLKLYEDKTSGIGTDGNVEIENIADVKNPNWDQGFSSIQLGDDARVISAIKQYKSFASNVGGKQFVNWVADGSYDFDTTQREASTQLGNAGKDFIFHTEEDALNEIEKGWIGPGPMSLLINTKTPSSNSKLRQQILDNNDNSRFGTIVANISHTPLPYNDTYTPYYGFGNFRPIKNTDPESPNYGTEEAIVFDGDVYITPAEFTNMFKTYDFNDQKATLISGQDVYYIPMESRINTFFDYGMNYRNTSSTNLMLEPGEITGIASQARPLHQYNMIYSDNNTSIDVFSPQVPADKDQIDHIPHRICYSQLKTDGENIDNWQIFRPADFIDVDSKYGEITHLLTSDNSLYYWQNKAFGKLSVNERSLVKDENSNSIQLGTGGVLNRYDYLSTRYGMRVADRAAVAAEHGIYWIDVDSKAIPAFTGNSVVNYSEICNVQNLVNQHMDENYIPTIYYDLQNYELLCGIKDSWQHIFNLKLNCATSVYTRDYEKCVDIENTLYGILQDNNTLKYCKLNYIQSQSNNVLLKTSVILFAINQSASLTKIYDNQKIVLVDKVEQTGRKDYPVIKPIDYPFLINKTWEFNTDYQHSSRKPEAYRDTENNVWYAVPRNGEFDDYLDEHGVLVKGVKPYGDRLRGKWITTKIEIDNSDNKPYAISHIITKFRQSYS